MEERRFADIPRSFSSVRFIGTPTHVSVAACSETASGRPASRRGCLCQVPELIGKNGLTKPYVKPRKKGTPKVGFKGWWNMHQTASVFIVSMSRSVKPWVPLSKTGQCTESPLIADGFAVTMMPLTSG